MDCESVDAGRGHVTRSQGLARVPSAPQHGYLPLQPAIWPRVQAGSVSIVSAGRSLTHSVVLGLMSVAVCVGLFVICTRKRCTCWASGDLTSQSDAAATGRRWKHSRRRWQRSWIPRRALDEHSLSLGLRAPFELAADCRSSIARRAFVDCSYPSVHGRLVGLTASRVVRPPSALLSRLSAHVCAATQPRGPLLPLRVSAARASVLCIAGCCRASVSSAVSARRRRHAELGPSSDVDRDGPWGWGAVGIG